MEDKFVAMDTENSPEGFLGQWSVAFRDNQGQLSIWANSGRVAQRELEEVFSKSAVVFHNYKWDSRVLKRNNMPLPQKFHDTLIAAYCMGLGKQEPKDSAKTKSGSAMVGGLGLKYLARRQLGMVMKTWADVYDKPELVPEYNAMDSVATLLLWEKWKDQLPWHYWNIDMPLLQVLMAIEDRGIQVDPEFLKKYADSLDRQLEETNLPLNVFATQEIQSYVYGTLGITPWRFTAGGDPSTDSDVLEAIDDPIVKEILKYKELYKERNTYAKGYMRAVDGEGRIHTELKQVSTATGRLSSANPNLQNVAAKGDMKKLFIAPEGKKLLRLDWERMELWILAVLAQDERLLESLRTGDPHQETGDFLGIPRSEGRNVNYLIPYGGGAWKLSVEFGVPLDRAKEMISKFFGKYPGIKKYQEQQIAIANNEHKVTNYFGRTRRIDAMYAQDWRVKKEGEREAINMPIQGAGADIVKLAMIDLHKHNAPMLLQVHDELLFEVDEKEAEDYAQWLRVYVPTITEVEGVQFPVEVGIGANWKEASGK